MPKLFSRQKSNLNWIIQLLNDNNLDYVIIGGLAAKIYGSKRELADIDIGLSEKGLKRIEVMISDLIVEDYSNGFQNDLWNLKLLVIRHNGQEYDLFDKDSLKFYSQVTKRWERINFSQKQSIDGYNVLKLAELIRYKTLLHREVDLLDLQYLIKRKKI